MRFWRPGCPCQSSLTLHKELTCEQPFEPRQDNSVRAVTLATVFLMVISSQTEHKEEWVHYGGAALGFGERRWPAIPPVSEGIPLIVSPKPSRVELESFVWQNISAWVSFVCVQMEMMTACKQVWWAERREVALGLRVLEHRTVLPRDTALPINNLGTGAAYQWVACRTKSNTADESGRGWGG